MESVLGLLGQAFWKLTGIHVSQISKLIVAETGDKNIIEIAFLPLFTSHYIVTNSFDCYVHTVRMPTTKKRPKSGFAFGISNTSRRLLSKMHVAPLPLFCRRIKLEKSLGWPID